MINLNKLIRTLNRNKLNTVIKILGITISLVTLAFITVYVKHETSYDKHISESENIFRVVRNWQESEVYSGSTPTAFLSEITAAFPEVKAGTRLYHLSDKIITYQGKIYHETDVFGVDSGYLETLTPDIFLGDRIHALDDPGSVLISRSKSRQYFGDQDPIGQQLKFEGYHFNENNDLFTVKGVYEDYPVNSHFRPDMLLSLKSFRIYYSNQYTNHNILTYVKLKDGIEKEVVESKLPEFMYDFYGKEYYEFARTTYLLQPLTRIHLDTWVYPYGYETAAGSSKTIVLFPLLGLLIFSIAGINYINLSISEGFKKSKSFGINRISGAGKFYFFRLFLNESSMIIGLAIIFTIVICPVLLPAFNSMMDRQLAVGEFLKPGVLLLFLSMTAIICLLTSLIPALVFSGKKAIEFLSSKFSEKNRHTPFLSTSQTIQFAICIFLFIGSILVFKQIQYINKKTIETLNTNNIMVIRNIRYLERSRDSFKQDILKLPGVETASLCSTIPGSGDWSDWGYPIDEALKQEHVNVFECDHDYFNTLDIRIKEGRFFDPDHSSDADGIVLNERVIEQLGWEDDPIGKRYYLGKAYHVIGVAENVHFEPLQYKIASQAYIPNRHETSASHIMIKIHSDGMDKTIRSIDNIWKGFVPHREMYYGFLDREYEKWYKTERKTAALSIILSIVAIVLSNLGLFASILFIVQYKTKEIGIRKVNGATSIEITSMLNQSFIKWVGMAFFIAGPLSWLAMKKWLESFAYKTDMSWWVFALAGGVTIIIALLTVSLHSFRAANRNPVEALRYE